MSKKIKIAALSLSLAAIIAVSFWAGYFVGRETSPKLGLGVIEEAWDIIFEDYVDKDSLDADALIQGAIMGMVEALDDPYTAYLDVETYQLSVEDLEGKFEGIGAWVAVKDDQLVLAPLADSPAGRAGIRTGDILLEIDGQPTAGMSLVEAVLKVRGPKDTEVTLLVLHEGETEPEEISIVRAEIEIISVNFKMMGDIAYINLTDFTDRTAEELSLAMESITQQAASGIILDLRSNLGGPLDSAVDVAGFFLDETVVLLYVVDNEGQQGAYLVEPNAMVTDLPLVVLVDEYSASASEVLAGALQDYGRATIAGSVTFGKGSVNILYQLEDGSGLYITTARWLTPDGHLIEGEGLYPDYELELEGEDAIQWAIDFLGGE